MADKLAPYDRSGLRVVPYYAGERDGETRANWRIDVRVGVRQAGLDLSAEVLADDDALSAALDTFNANLRHRAINRDPVTPEAVRAFT